MTDSFPRLAARTGTFRFGHPRSFTVSPDGTRVVFLRSLSGATRSHALWVWDADGGERLIADPAELLTSVDEDLTAEERARRERARVTTSGVVDYSTDAAVDRVAFALSSRLFVAELDTGAVRELPTQAVVIDPRLDPTGARVAYAGDRGLHVVTVADAAKQR